MVTIEFKYSRRGELYFGSYNVSYDKSGVAVDWDGEFEELTFANMIRELHLLLQDVEEAKVILVRTELKSLFPYHLDKGTVDLIKSDPVAAIKSMSPAPRVVDARSSRVSTLPSTRDTEPTVMSTEPNQQYIAAGHAALSEAFGEYIYIRRLGSTIECPFCSFFKGKLEFDKIASCVDLSCPSKCAPISGSAEGNEGIGWFVIKTTSLLEIDVPKYFIPRRWNDKGWISRPDLKERYRIYSEEKKQCLEMIEEAEQSE